MSTIVDRIAHTLQSTTGLNRVTAILIELVGVSMSLDQQALPALRVLAHSTTAAVIGLFWSTCR